MQVAVITVPKNSFSRLYLDFWNFIWFGIIRLNQQLLISGLKYAATVISLMLRGKPQGLQAFDSIVLFPHQLKSVWEGAGPEGRGVHQ